MGRSRNPTRTLGTWLLALCLAMGLGFVTVASAQEGYESDEAAIEAGKEALGGWSNYPWYDSTADDLRPLNVKPPTPITPSSSDWWPDWLGSMIALLWYAFLWVFLPGLALVILYYLVRTFMESESQPAVIEEETVEYDIDRIEALPTKIRTPAGDLLTEARRFYEQGDYRQAIVYLYSHQLLQLDKKQLIRLTKGKTNRQYLREVASRRTIRELFEPTMLTFEDAFFGGQELSKTAFEACWQRQQPLDRQLQGASA